MAVYYGKTMEDEKPMDSKKSPPNLIYPTTSHKLYIAKNLASGQKLRNVYQGH